MKEHLKIGESPVWEEKDNSLLFVDITGKKVYRWNSFTKEIEDVSVGKKLHSVQVFCYVYRTYDTSGAKAACTDKSHDDLHVF